MTQPEYIKIIENQAAKPTSIKPVIKHINGRTENTSLFAVEQFGNKFIYKISDSKTSFDNLMLAQLLLKNDIPVPDSKVFISNHQYFEKYKLMPGTPLSVAISNGSLSGNDLEHILYDILICEKRISEIELTNNSIKQKLALCETRKQHHQKDFGKIIASIYYIINKTQKAHGTVTLRHADLNPSNILLDANNNFQALLDLDSFTLCNEYKMLSQVLLFWPHISVNKLIEMYENIFNTKIDKKYLQKLTYSRRQKAKITKILRKAKTIIRSA